MQLGAVLGSRSRSRGRAGAEFPGGGGSGRGAAAVAVLLLPAHPRGRHLQQPAPNRAPVAPRPRPAAPGGSSRPGAGLGGAPCRRRAVRGGGRGAVRRCEPLAPQPPPPPGRWRRAAPPAARQRRAERQPPCALPAGGRPRARARARARAAGLPSAPAVSRPLVTVSR